ncbi:MAG: hypothetical protein JWL59_4143 [Chthoniobacteraceae bacterium]|nr:hypothetical protein [Chthoniobacteraceae bacterium]
MSPGSAITGFPLGIVVDGAMHSNDAQTVQAQQDALAAYNILAGETPSSLLDYSAIDLDGLTLTPGTYYFSTGAQLSGTLTLDHRSNPGGAFHFQIGSTLNTAVDAQVIMLGGSDNDVFWQVGSSATIGGGTEFTGNIIAHSSITFGTGASVINGRAFALNGAITLDNNTISAAAVPEPGNWIFGALLLGLACTRTFARSLQVAGKV